MRVDGISTVPARNHGGERHESDRESSSTVSGSQALVPVAPAAPSREPRTRNAHAAFLAHLIAVNDQLPQTRERRRADPHVAIDAYRATAALFRDNQ
jgi:hypothetical protein